ncbi:hypothetical protein EUGRSUZ_E00363 [Eucalyptus grandis]|uniref:Uncharacterized protein n=2 Tax=Eucalyptus grandis TaxID=71139 RepID=A0ACC3KRM6_EUCGR|nr:hypothetical protein EUGRSUZ_E00363 [Eucalyptus grandis]
MAISSLLENPEENRRHYYLHQHPEIFRHPHLRFYLSALHNCCILQFHAFPHSSFYSFQFLLFSCPCYAN